jgi:hypothetical protein
VDSTVEAREAVLSASVLAAEVQFHCHWSQKFK